jgi:hypothetical protein
VEIIGSKKTQTAKKSLPDNEHSDYEHSDAPQKPSSKALSRQVSKPSSASSTTTNIKWENLGFCKEARSQEVRRLFSGPSRLRGLKEQRTPVASFCPIFRSTATERLRQAR